MGKLGKNPCTLYIGRTYEIAEILAISEYMCIYLYILFIYLHDFNNNNDNIN